MKPRNIREALRGKLTEEELRSVRAFDIIGDIAVLRLPEELQSKAGVVGEAILLVHKNVKTVLLQKSPVSGEYRLRQLEHVAGEKKTVTIHREFGCLFEVDLSKVYFSPRLSFDRMRIARKVGEGEIVTNLFAGVGCYSIIIAKHTKVARVYSIDINPDAYTYMCRNVSLNRVGDRVIPILGDAREVTSSLEKADRILMPLPEKAREFLDVALEALKPRGVIHFYDIGREPDPFSDTIAFLSEKLGEKLKVLEKRRLRSYAPRITHIVLDLFIDKTK